MRLTNITRALHFGIFLSALLLVVPAIASAAGHIAPVGDTTQEGSQLIVYYDQTEDGQDTDSGGGPGFAGTTFLQVTNGSVDTGVNIHVQIFADDEDDSSNLCREHDFTDTLTPNDTHIYVLEDLDLTGTAPDDGPSGGNNSGGAIAIDIDETRGFVVVTSVNQTTLPRRAIAFNHLFGSVWIVEDFTDFSSACDFEANFCVEYGHRMNAMARKAVSVATGAETPDGVLLDGITNALVLLQPDFLSFSFNDFNSEGEASVMSIAFSDNYSDPSGEYRAQPTTTVWDPLHFDEFENGVSCQQHALTCFVSLGLTNDWNDLILEGNSEYSAISPDICPAVQDNSGTETFIGYIRIRVSGIGGLDNNIGIINLAEIDSNEDSSGARYMVGE